MGVVKFRVPSIRERRMDEFLGIVFSRNTGPRREGEDGVDG